MRVENLYSFDARLSRTAGKIIVGLDEAGRGPLAGPVVAAAVVLTCQIPGVDDSKKLDARSRKDLFFEILRNSITGIGLATSMEIDRYNILRATNIAMLRALSQLSKVVRLSEALLIVDGTNIELPGFCINLVKADMKSASVAAASIVAKFLRDKIMEFYDSIYPGYGFLFNKGYPTPEHLRALKQLGPSRIHRKTFASKQLKGRR
ncbi:MAG: ribonuclease [Thermotogota bacterium]|nr:ribonuclease [Thermotogota bacterium]MDK2864599.1 ribonuclease [Thermotogota bacterium]HCZ05617.1 ribonuclease HII [Thermotogota bacterium]